MPLQPSDMLDDYQWLPGSARYPLADLGEHAARMGSPVTYDRRGEVVWMDVGDRGLAPYAVSGSGALNTVKVSTQYPLHGCYNLKLTAGNTDNWLSEITKSMSNVCMLRPGLEVAAYMATNGIAFKVGIYHRDGAQSIWSILKVDYVLKQLLCYDHFAAWQKIADIGVPNDPYGIYHHIKLVVDYDLNEYVRALYDDGEYDISGITMPSVATTDIPSYLVQVQLTGRPLTNDVAYVGHVIVTGNEP